MVKNEFPVAEAPSPSDEGILEAKNVVDVGCQTKFWHDVKEVEIPALAQRIQVFAGADLWRQLKLTLPQRSSPASGPRGVPHNQPLSWKNILIPSHCNRFSRIADDNHDQMASDHPPGQRWGFWVAWCPLAPLQKAHRKWKMDVTIFTIWWFIPFMKWPARGRYPSSKGDIIIIINKWLFYEYIYIYINTVQIISHHNYIWL